MRRLAEVARYGAVVGAGLAVDIGLAMFLAGPMGMPLSAAAALGLLAGAGANYLGHEYWTFRRVEGGLSARRLGLFALATLIALAIRVVAVMLLSWSGLFGRAHLPVLLLAASISFAANFLLARHLVFATSRKASS